MAEEAGLRITISADVREAILNLTNLTDATGELAVEGVGNITAVNQALQSLRQAQQETGNPAELQTLNRAIKDLSTQMAALKRAGTEGFDELGNRIAAVKGQAQIAASGMQEFSLTTGQARVAFLDLGRVVTGQGFNLRSLASNFSLIGPGATVAVAALYGLYEVLSKQTDAEKHAEEEAKRLHDTLVSLKSVGEVTEISTGSEEGNIARVQALAAAIQDTNKTYAERKNALDELRETNKAYFGDLTLEANSLATLSARVRDYSQALITEAITKGFTEEISKTSIELSKQIPILNQLAAAYQRQSDEVDRITAANTGKVSGREGISSDVVNAQNQLDNFKNQYLKQNEIVATLKDQINQYTQALNENIAVQIKQKPLKLPPAPTDEYKKIIPVLQEVQRIYDELSKPNKEPLFKRADNAGIGGGESPLVKLIKAQIEEAKKNLRDAANNSGLSEAYKSLVAALNAKLTAVENPQLHAHPVFLADIDDKEVEKFKEETGKQLTERTKKLPPIKTGIKVDPLLVLQGLKLNEFNEKISEILRKTSISGFKKLGEDIGSALAGGLSSQDFFGGFLKILGEGLKELGEYGLSIAPLITAIKTAIRSLNPALLLPASVGLIALGSFLEAKATSSVHAFATGGIVTGPTLGLVGEAGPEAIIPLHRLNNMIGSIKPQGPIPITGTVRVSGRDIAIALARDSKLQNLTS